MFYYRFFAVSIIFVTTHDMRVQSYARVAKQGKEISEASEIAQEGNKRCVILV